MVAQSAKMPNLVTLATILLVDFVVGTAVVAIDKNSSGEYLKVERPK